MNAETGQMDPSPLNIPTGLKPLTVQAAGHRMRPGKFGYGIFQEDDGKCVLKAVKGDKEQLFYSQVFAEECSDPLIIELRSFLARYYGCYTFNGLFGCYIKLENIIFGFQRPSVMDVKIGRVTHEPGAPPDKVHRETEKYQRTKTILGFCVPGFKVFNEISDKYTFYDKDYGKGLTEHNVKNALQLFLGGPESNTEARLAPIFYSRLLLIREWFIRQRIFHFYASSLLFVYESLSTISPRTDIRLIDFAHVFPAQNTSNENFLFGLENLVNMWKEILKDKVQ